MRTDELAVVRRRMRAQRLAAAPFASPAEAVAWLGAMQAQEYAEAKWSVGERVRGCTGADVEAAFDRGEILRTHVLRPTWHFLAAADIRWLLALSAPRVHALNRYMYRQTGLDEATLARGCELADGEPRSRSARRGRPRSRASRAWPSSRDATSAAAARPPCATSPRGRA